MRAAIVLLAVLIGAAAPARAWCEANCLAPAHDSATPHCPPDDSTTGSTIIASGIADCPVIEAARPSQARFEVHASAPVSVARPSPLAPQHPSTPAPQHPSAAFVKRLIPLRI